MNDPEPWVRRHPRLACAIIIAGGLAGSMAGGFVATALWGGPLWRLGITGAQLGFAVAGGMLGAAAGIVIVIVTGAVRARAQ